MPMTAPIINSSIITSITPIVNKSTDNTIPMILRFEYNWLENLGRQVLAKRIELSNAQYDQPNYFH